MEGSWSTINNLISNYYVKPIYVQRMVFIIACFYKILTIDNESRIKICFHQTIMFFQFINLLYIIIHTLYYYSDQYDNMVCILIISILKCTRIY